MRCCCCWVLLLPAMAVAVKSQVSDYSTAHQAVAAAGCTDSAADNYEGGATVDSGDCAYTCSTLISKLEAPAGTECLVYDLESGTWPDSLGTNATRSVAEGSSWVLQGRPAKGWCPGRPANKSRPEWLPPLGFRLQVFWARLALRYANVSHRDFDSSGGAVRAYNSNLTVEASLFEGNHAPSGGAISAEFSTVRVLASYFEGNHAPYGGAIEAESSNLTVQGSWLRGNTASYHGGAIQAESSNVTVQGSWLEVNTAGNGGAVNSRSSRVALEGLFFEGNTASGGGGAVCVEAGDSDDAFTAVLSGCTGRDNADSNGKALAIGYNCYDTGVTNRSRTDKDLRLPRSAGAGVDAWEYISYTHPESRAPASNAICSPCLSCDQQPLPPGAATSQCAAGTWRSTDLQ